MYRDFTELMLDLKDLNNKWWKAVTPVDEMPVLKQMMIIAQLLEFEWDYIDKKPRESCD